MRDRLTGIGDGLCWILILMAISSFAVPNAPALMSTALRALFP